MKYKRKITLSLFFTVQNLAIFILHNTEIFILISFRHISEKFQLRADKKKHKHKAKQNILNVATHITLTRWINISLPSVIINYRTYLFPSDQRQRLPPYCRMDKDPQNHF